MLRSITKPGCAHGPIPVLIFSLLALFPVCRSSWGLEVFATLSPTDSSSRLNTTTNPLDLSLSSSASVYFWLSYSPAERTAINATGGLYGGGFSIPFSNPSFANISNASDFQEAGVNWITFVPSVNSPGPRLGFTVQDELAIPLPTEQTSVLVAMATISKLSPSGSSIANLSSYTAYPWLDDNFTPYSTTYTPFTVVPEPSTYALAAVACIVLGFLARRKSSQRNSLFARRGATSLVPR